MADLVALVYRAGCKACGRGCCRHAKGGGRQYPFASVGELEQWSARRPYRDEVLTVIAFVGMRERSRATMPAPEAAEWLVMQLVLRKVE